MKVQSSRGDVDVNTKVSTTFITGSVKIPSGDSRIDAAGSISIAITVDKSASVIGAAVSLQTRDCLALYRSVDGVGGLVSIQSDLTIQSDAGTSAVSYLQEAFILLGAKVLAMLTSLAAVLLRLV